MGNQYVSKAKREALAARMRELGIRDDALTERFVLGSGSGGQKINKTSSCVYLKHDSTGIEVKCQRSRSREMNRFLARRDLCDRIEEQVRGAASRRRREQEKIRRQKRRRSRRQKERMLAEKKKQAAKKRLRQKVGEEE